ncbi:DUF2459 domain-containing protein [Tenacibaculum xiamenense]|uniref:DUF2459 domain-containing protein n=1 Tax=Tenacibaculum xiamenense TaxID=1261553 RepID=UPI003893C912
MKLLKKIVKYLFYVLAIPILYVLVSLILTFITVDREIKNQVSDKTIYLNTNGVHLDVVIPKENINNKLLKGIRHKNYERYLAFGWGEENFYLNTPNWSDLTFSNAFKALFLESSTLVHITRYRSIQPDWIAIKISSSELNKLNSYLLNSFQKDTLGSKIILEDKGYSFRDDFYRAKGSYSCFKTCNSWVNSAFKESGLKACLWTPFDFGLMNKYKQ